MLIDWQRVTTKLYIASVLRKSQPLNTKAHPFGRGLSLVLVEWPPAKHVCLLYLQR